MDPMDPETPAVSAERDRLADDIGDFRRALIPGFLLHLLRGFEGDEPSVIQIATLYVLDHPSAPTLRELAERIDRSVSATSRLVDQLVRRGLVDRHEDPDDRRARRIALTKRGTGFLREFERARADAQLEVMAHLTAEERELVTRAMALLGEASRRRPHVHPTHPEI
ncbi:DNA-binding transcriptional regulator, MarR family [Streptosporangium subroseum]|uniref:DNA-binding transcriptional regulator, MarR family n=1 Tax=Streptosporangium subroseum TaxID=106412 RepID=A0A239GD88_9ACTN|nr:MarR family transcriptional regulator [Streptosporangium subroseum]SNS67079.1 DNA-binding transcriptional regulator, MarR family [Streptosporangium subroseum]